MKIFRSPVFWTLFAGLVIALCLFFLLPSLGVKDALMRLLWTALPALIACLIALLLTFFRLKKALKAQNADQGSANPFEAEMAIKPWLELLKKETLAALDILKSSAKGKVRVGRNPLDFYRFFLVLGNAGAGKTTLLENSGIHFPRLHPSASDRAKQSLHFTQWRLSNQGIFLEAPSRYVTGEEGDEEFKYWLSLLEKEGKRVAADGILLTVSLRELLEAGNNVRELAARYREKIALAMNALRLDLPVYLVFTHADLMPGFREFFENLKEPDNRQVLGATFALRGNLAPVRQRFEREYKKIWESLEARTAQRLAQAGSDALKKEIFFFPNEFGAAQDLLAGFVEHLFKESLHKERAMFRGFFLTSAVTAQLDPFQPTADPFADQEPEALHALDHKGKLRAPNSPPLRKNDGATGNAVRAFFIHLVFGGVLKNDRSLAQFPAYRSGSLSRQTLVASILLAAAGLLVSVFAVAGFLNARSYLDGVSRAIADASRARWTQPAKFKKEYAALDSLLSTLRGLRADGGGFLPPGYRRTGAALELAEKAHLSQIARMAANDALRNLAATLEMSAKYYNPAEHAKLRENLRLYLLLTEAGKDHLKDLKPKELASLLAPLWAQEILHKYGAENMPANLEADLEEHALVYAEKLIDGETPPLPRGDANLIRTARQSLVGTPSIEGLYAALVAAENPARDLTLAEMGVPPDAALQSSGRVRGFYTQAAFDDDAMARLAKGAEEPHQKDWVLGEGAVSTLPSEMQDQRQLYRALSNKYYQEYAREWTAFLQTLTVRLPREPGLAAGKLSGYASATQGLPAVLSRLLAEVDLSGAPSAAGNAVADKIKNSALGELASLAAENRDADKKRLKEKFAFVEELNGSGGGGGMLQEYLSALKGLSDVMGKLAAGSDNGTDALEAAQALFSGRSESPFNICWNEANKVRARYNDQTWLTPLLENPVRDAAGYLAGTAGDQLETAYKSKVLPFYNQNLRGRYPLAKTSQQEANFEDLKSFFNPDNGVFSAFANGKLSHFLKAEGNGLTPKQWNGIRLRFHPAALQGIAQGMAVAKRMYTEAPAGLRVYSLNLSLPEAKNTARITFRLGEDRISVKPGEGQARMTFRWPNENSYKGAEILVENVGGGSQGKRVDGSWGFLKLLDGARALNVRTGGLSAKWRFNVAKKYDVDVGLEGQIPERENPLTFPEYYRFDLPASLIQTD